MAKMLNKRVSAVFQLLIFVNDANYPQQKPCFEGYITVRTGINNAGLSKIIYSILTFDPGDQRQPLTRFYNKIYYARYNHIMG